MVGWSSQLAIFHPRFSSGSPVLFQIQEPLHTNTLLEKMIFIHIIGSSILVLSNIWDFYQLLNLFFFMVGQWTWNGNIFNDRQLLPLILSSTIFIALLFLYHHHYLFQGLTETGVLLALNISNIGLGFMEIMQLTCITSWLAMVSCIYRFYLVYFRWIVNLS